MKLSPKAIRFIIEALNYRIKSYEKNLDIGNFDSDETSEIANDIVYLEAIREELAKTVFQN